MDGIEPVIVPKEDGSGAAYVGHRFEDQDGDEVVVSHDGDYLRIIAHGGAIVVPKADAVTLASLILETAANRI